MKRIIVNGEEHKVEASHLTYEQIVALVYPATVVYSRGAASKPQGILSRGQKVRVVDGMVIDCMMTGAA